MGISKTNRNFTSVQTMMAEVVNSLLDSGAFVAESVNDATGVLTVDSNLKNVMLKATDVIDPLAIDESDTTNPNYSKRQPWNLYIECGDANINEDGDVDGRSPGFINIYALTSTNYTSDSGEVEIAVNHYARDGAELGRSGLLSIGSLEHTILQRAVQPIGAGVATDRVNLERESVRTWRYEYWDIDTSRVSPKASPISYQLCTTDHGIMFMMWAESFDKEGDKCFWFNLQRMVDKTGTVITEGKSPLFCVFSQNGGGGKDVNTPEEFGIQHFIVRESDINAPTFPISSVIDKADSTRIINSVQQVSKGEESSFTLNFPRGLNTHRYSYPHELDMFVTTSADSVSQYTDVEVTAYEEETPRKYRAMNANFDNNTGMRVLMLIEGPTITPEDSDVSA